MYLPGSVKGVLVDDTLRAEGCQRLAFEPRKHWVELEQHCKFHIIVCEIHYLQQLTYITSLGIVTHFDPYFISTSSK